MLEVDRIAKSYGLRVVLRELSFAVRPGEMFGFCGSNGAGKTTAMRVIMGLTAPVAGVVRWRGEQAGDAARGRFGYMPEERGLYPKMRPRDQQLVYFSRLRGMTVLDAQRRSDAWLERLGVSAGPRDTLEKLSLGNQQKVQLAAALIHDPELLVLDEPFSGLDPMALDAVSAALRERCRQGVGVIFSSHQLSLVEELCDSVGIIKEGSLVAPGTVEELRQAGSGGRRLRVEVAEAPADWIPVSDADLLAAARRVGRLEHFRAGRVRPRPPRSAKWPSSSCCSRRPSSSGSAAASTRAHCSVRTAW